jgi:hypothetical protein
MGPVTKVLLLLAVVVPVTAYVAGSLASPGAPPPADHSPVILRDAPADEPETPATGTTPGDDRERGGDREQNGGGDRQRDGAGGGGSDEARVVTPQPTPVGEDDDDEWDDDGPDDDDTDDERTDGDD